ncbi:MAG: SpoIIE family protein phosphatase [Bdellovibrionales bacterium]|nr:SpoIIE family protein phosphatase [Bdellovibrionales bacterium]
MTPSTKPRRTLGIKLLLGATLIVVVLMSSAFVLAYNFLSEETSSFTYEAQSSHSQLLGQQFVSTLESATQILKLLPEFDEKTSKALNQQNSLKNLEVFSVSRGNSLQRIYSWGEVTLKTLPSLDSIGELEKLGVSYDAIPTDVPGAGTYLYTILENKDPASKYSILRAKLNLEPLRKRSSGIQLWILSRTGSILLDTRNSTTEGTKIHPEHPLFLSASKSPISLGTLEYRMPDTKEAHLGTYNLPGYNVMILSTIKFHDAMRGTYLLLEKMLLMGLALLGASLIVVVVFSIRLTRPLAELTEATFVISGGNFDLELKETSSDEIGILSKSMNQMSRKIKELLLESIEKVKIEQELEIASNLQQNLIPPSKIDTARYGIRSHYQSAKECGGDWWGYVETPRDLTLMISDATGHGLPPAMLTAAAHGCFSAIQKILVEFPDLTVSPKKLLGIANEVIVNSAKSELNMTMFIATYNFEKKTLTFANAGHNNPWILRGREGSSKFESLKARGTRLGERTDFQPSEDVTIPFYDEDRLFLYTDGLLENVNSAGELMEKDKIRSKIAEASTDGLDRISDTLEQDLAEFYKDIIPNDDVTYVLFSRTPHSSGTNS